MYDNVANYSPWMVGFITTLGASLFLLLLFGKRIIGSTSAIKEPQKLPPGSSGWPFLGETIAFITQTNTPQNPRKFIDEKERRYGPIFRCSLFGRPRMIVSVDPAFNKFVLQNEQRLFQAKYPASCAKLIGKYGLLNVHGELQRKLHGTAVSLLKYEKLGSEFMEDTQYIFLSAMKKWETQRDIPLEHCCNQIVLNLMGKKLMDLPPAEEMEGIYKAFHEFVGAVLVLPLNIPGTAYSRGFKARKFIINKIYDCIKERREHTQVVRNDLLSKLVEEGLFSDEIIADFILFLLFAGYETSSTAMAFAVKFLTETPSALEQLTAEHDGILKAKGTADKKLTWDDYLSMKFTQCVIKETLRMATAGPCNFRETKQDIKYQDYVIPKGWDVLVFLVGTHLDGKYHSEPLKFNPWRWQHEEALELSEDPCYMPFGRGARLCPGYHLARFEMALFLHHMVTKFRWEPSRLDLKSFFPLPSIAKGFPIRLYPRSADVHRGTV